MRTSLPGSMHSLVELSAAFGSSRYCGLPRLLWRFHATTLASARCVAGCWHTVILSDTPLLGGDDVFEVHRFRPEEIAHGDPESPAVNIPRVYPWDIYCWWLLIIIMIYSWDIYCGWPLIIIMITIMIILVIRILIIMIRLTRTII